MQYDIAVLPKSWSEQNFLPVNREPNDKKKTKHEQKSTYKIDS